MGFDNAIEGCVDGYFLLSADSPPTEDITFALGIGGTATNGTDYPTILDSITLAGRRNIGYHFLFIPT